MTLESKHLLIAAAAVVLSAMAAGAAKAQTSVPTHLPRNGLVAVWLADGNTKDTAGKNHGTIQQGAVFTAGRCGKTNGAFGFKGKNGFITVPDTAQLDTDDAFTLSAWIRPKGYAHNKGDRYSMIVSKWFTSGYCGDYIFALTTKGVPFLQISQKGGQANWDRVDARSAVPTARWTHLAATFDRGQLKIYINGILDASKASRLIHTDRSEYGHDEVVIGGYWKDGFYNFHGAIDEVCIWNRALNASEVSAITATAPGAHVTRDDRGDRVELKNGSVLIGTIETRAYTVTVFFGRIKIPAARVIGAARDNKKNSPMRLILTDGQVVAAEMTRQTVQLKIEGGSTLKIPVDGIRQFGYRVSKDRPNSPVTSGPMVILRGGSRLAWTKCREKLQLKTPYAKVDLTIRDISTIKPAGPRSRNHQVVLRNGSALTGMLLPEKLTLKLQLGSDTVISRAKIWGFVTSGRPVTPTGTAMMVMRNADRLSGRLTDKTLAIQTEFGRVKVSPGDLLTAEFDPQKPGELTAKIRDNTIIRGRLVAPAVTFEIMPGGPTMKVKPGEITSIKRASPPHPPGIRKKVGSLAAQLGVEPPEDGEATGVFEIFWSYQALRSNLLL